MGGMASIVSSADDALSSVHSTNVWSAGRDVPALCLICAISNSGHKQSFEQLNRWFVAVTPEIADDR